MELLVIDPGPATLIQDLGRPGLAHLGVGASGAMDLRSHALAQRLVGNAPGAAGLEILLGPVTLEPSAPCWLAVTGADGSLLVDGRPAATRTAVYCRHQVRIGRAQAGIRRYLAVRGGVAVPAVLGSRSRDTLAGLGPPPRAAGDRLPIGDDIAGPIPWQGFPPPPPAGGGSVGVRFGPRDDWFSARARHLLLSAGWTVDARSDRTGIRLSGPPLDRVVHRELPSEGMVPGSIQVSPDGVPTLLMADAPVTGGYPVVAVADPAGLELLAQLAPGDPLQFHRARALPSPSTGPSRS